MDIVKGIAKILAELEEMRLRLDEMSAALTELALGGKVPDKKAPKVED